MKPTVGAQLFSAVSDVSVVVVRAPREPTEIHCGGVPMLSSKPPGPTHTAGAGLGEDIAVGKRYVLDDIGLEIICTKAGPGTLTIGGTALTMAKAKPLPSSD
jgi:hypothetical protein